MQIFGTHDAQTLAQLTDVALRDKARAQLGTVGSGNHYVDVFADENDVVWVGVHFGSRGFGHTVASGSSRCHKARPGASVRRSARHCWI